MSLKIITIGRPSVGKSSVLNTLAGDKLFETGKKEGSLNQIYQKKSFQKLAYFAVDLFMKLALAFRLYVQFTLAVSRRYNNVALVTSW